MTPTDVSIVICTYNRSSLLKATLASLTEMNQSADFRWELVVVDNNSNDDTSDVVRAFASESDLDVRYIFEPAQGLSHARNRGIQEARGEIIVFTDDDVILDKSWLPNLVETFDDPNTIAAGGKTLPLWIRPKPRWFYEEQPYGLEGVFVHFDLGEKRCKAIKPPFGANMAFRRTAFLKHGVFRTDLGRSGGVLGSGEETEFFRRIMNGGGSIEYSPRAIVYHPVPPERLRKSYVQSVFFHAGRADFRVNRSPHDAVLYFGIPRYLFREILEGFFVWMFSIQPKTRFRSKLRVFHIAGMIAESRNGFRSKNTILPRVQGN